MKFASVPFLLVLFCQFFGEQYPRKFEGRYEEWSSSKIELMAQFIPKNPIIIQAGGYYGDETKDLAEYWPLGKIISFEPNPNAFEILTTKTSYLENVYTYNFALNSYSGTAPFYICYGSSGNSELYEHVSSLLAPSDQMRVHYYGPVIDVNCVTMDDWCRENLISHVDLLCLDVRGSELQVLVNSPYILRTVKCIYVHTNLFPFRINMTTYPDLKKFLERSGFVLLSHWYREGLEGDAIFIREHK